MQRDNKSDKEILSKKINLTNEEKAFEKNHIKAEKDLALIDRLKDWQETTMVSMFMLPFLIMTTLNVKTALAMIAILALVMFPISIIRHYMLKNERIPEIVTTGFCVVGAMSIVILISVALRRFFPEISGTVGRYLYLLSAYPVIYSVFGNEPPKRLSTVMNRCVKNVVFFAELMLITAIIREIFGNNQILNTKLPINLKFSSITLPFFGFILVALVIGLVSKLTVYINIRRSKRVDDEESA